MGEVSRGKAGERAQTPDEVRMDELGHALYMERAGDGNSRTVRRGLFKPERANGMLRHSDRASGWPLGARVICRSTGKILGQMDLGPIIEESNRT